MTSCLIILSLLIFCTPLTIFAKVKFELGEYIRSGVKITNGNGTILQNVHFVVQFKCRAPYPTHWVFNADDIYENIKNLNRNEWTDRKFKHSIQETQYDYIAWITLQVSKLLTPLTFKCEAVYDQHDIEIIHLIPIDDTVHLITRNELSAPKPSPKLISSRCDFNLSFIYIDAFGYFAQCSTGTTGKVVDNVVDHQCPYSATYCANAFRELKALRNTCIGNVSRSRERRPGKGWTRIGGHESRVLIPGVVVCSDGEQRGAQEYFFTAPDEMSGKRDLHFSWNEIQYQDMIWINPVLAKMYYTGQSISGTCTIPKYGFSFDPVLIVEINNTVWLEQRNFKEDQDDRTWKKTFDVKLDLDMVGSLDIKCVAPIWNSTKWAIKSVNISIREPIPPYFENTKEIVNLQEGEERRDIHCMAKGDPVPNVEWSVRGSFPGIQVHGDSLTFLRVTDYVQGEYRCTATNAVGQSATKIIVVRVSRKNVPDFGSSGANTVPIVIGVSIGVLALLFIAITYVYIKFYKLKFLTRLTPEQILEFREGKKNQNGEAIAIYSTEFIESLSYDTRFEIPKRNFHVDTRQALGSGAFGIVYKGTVRTDRGIIDAAFKTLKRGTAASTFKALLAELKILIHVGNHNCIVNLIGAWTENLRNGEVYVIVELCQCNLVNFLRENSSGFQNYVENGVLTAEPLTTVPYTNIQGLRQFSTLNLIQWGKEIATGLEFIASKHVIHGDIAARNVLLTFQLEAKVCDFGLARELVDYNYTRSPQCPLPWKWLAIESLRQLQFSTKSDVWAFGITLCEILTLGDVPYPGLAWSTSFVTELEQGLRMSQPPNAPNEIWELMLECWHQLPESRPTFTTLKNSLENFQTTFNHQRNSVTI